MNEKKNLSIKSGVLCSWIVCIYVQLLLGYLCKEKLRIKVFIWMI